MGASGKSYDEYDEPTIGIPYVSPGVPLLPRGRYENPLYVTSPVVAPPRQWDCTDFTDTSGLPPRAITRNLRGLRLAYTFYGDTSAPFECVFCGYGGMTDVKSLMSVPAVVACLVTILGICFLCSDNCFKHKRHCCPNCNTEVAVFRKTDPCMIVDPKSWKKISYAVPA